MKHNYKIYPIAIIGLLFIILFSCKKEPQKRVPTILTATVNPNDITATTIEIAGNITADGGYSINACGVCWSITPHPTITSNKTAETPATGGFASTITGLIPGTTYYVRNYASNIFGTAYGPELTITTPAALPAITTAVATNITQTSFTSGGNITSEGGTAVSARGICWSLTPNPTIADNKTTDGTGKGSFVSTINNLSPENTYYIRSYATNSVGTVYGEEITVRIGLMVPTLSTDAVSAIAISTASCGGTIINDGGATITARGICWSINLNPTIADSKTVDGNGLGSFSSNLNKLISDNTYYVRAYATNSVGTSYGSVVSFKTLDNGLTHDINNFVPQSTIDAMIALGMPIYTGTTPPNFEGIYLITPNVLIGTNVPNDAAPSTKFADMRVQFSLQDNTKLTAKVDWVQSTSSGTSTNCWIVGSGNNFTVFASITDGTALMAQAFSGTIDATGIKNLFGALFMIDNKGNGSYIPIGTGRVYYDSDSFSERVSSLRSLQIKSANASLKSSFSPLR